jgi:hypothetical protein
MLTKRYEINGAHRGGSDHSRLLLKKLTREGRHPPIDARIVDPEPGRASALVPTFSQRGIVATPQEGDAPLSSDANVRVLAMDDVNAITRILDKPASNDVLEAGILISVPTFGPLGGKVIGLAATLAPHSYNTKHDARLLFDRVATLAGERHTSRRSSTPFMNSMQMRRTRTAVHDRLTNSSVDYLELGVSVPDLFVVDGLSRGQYPIVAQEIRSNLPRRHLRDIATREIIPAVDRYEDTFGVAFYDSRDPWIFFVLAGRRDSAWLHKRSIELPVVAPPPSQINLGSPTAPLHARPHRQRDRDRASANPSQPPRPEVQRTFVTD